MKTKILYVDKNGMSMIMDSEDDYAIHLTMDMRAYPKLGTIVSALGFTTETPITQVSVYKRDKFIFYKQNITADLFKGVKDNFVLDKITEVSTLGDIDSDLYGMLKAESDDRFDFWFRKHCSIDSYHNKPSVYHRGHTCYWYGASITGVANLNVHVYGKTTIMTRTLSDVVIYIHDPDETTII